MSEINSSQQLVSAYEQYKQMLATRLGTVVDEDALIASVSKTSAVVTCENHSKVGGLYAAVSETLAAKHPAPIEYVAVEDEFGEVGPQDYLQKRFGLTVERILEKARLALSRKPA